MSDLLAATAELVAIPSLSTQEGLIADFVEAGLRQLGSLEVARVGDNVVARTALGRSLRLVLAGHLDTVPPKDNATPHVDGDTLWGLGSADMKGGLAVMMDLAASVPGVECDITYIFYVAEEIARSHSGLLALEASRPELLQADAAIVCEPTNSVVEAGCQGVLKAKVVLAGRRAHVARPWAGRNAVHRLGPSAVSGVELARARSDRGGVQVQGIPASSSRFRGRSLQRRPGRSRHGAQLPLRSGPKH